jgi:hypothetical protein
LTNKNKNTDFRNAEIFKTQFSQRIFFFVKHLLEYLGVFCVKMEISKLNNYLAETQQTSY